mgnify:FL=1
MMSDKSVISWFDFFFKHGWWFFLALIVNEKYGFAPLTAMIYSDSSFISWIPLLVITILASGIAPAMMGLSRFGINPWIGAVGMVCIAGVL